MHRQTPGTFVRLSQQGNQEITEAQRAWAEITQVHVLR